MRPPDPAPPPPPYPGLAAFGDEGRDAARDAALFFGRDREIAMVMANLRGVRLTVLHGPSGVGKTSLLRAGVACGLRASRRRRGPAPLVVVASRWREDPVGEVLQAVETEAARQGMRPAPSLAKDASLADALEAFSEEAGARLLLILDQFEDYFLYHPPDRDRFEWDLPELIGRVRVPVHVLLGMREDALAELDRFDGRVLGLFDNRLRLEPLDEGAATAALVRPVEAYNALRPSGQPEVSLDDDLPGRVIGELRGGVGLLTAGTGHVSGHDVPVEPAYLQLVMSRLWMRELGLGSRRLRTSTFTAMGGVAAIVRGHVEDALTGLEPADRRLAEHAFHHLVTPTGRKIAQSSADLASYLKVAETRLEPVLERLAAQDARILRALPPPPGAAGPRRFEIFHDILAQAILDWRARQVPLRLRRRVSVLAAVVAALAVVTVAVAVEAGSPTWLRRMELATVDARFQLRGAGAADKSLVFVDLDERSLRTLGGEGAQFIPRRRHARVIDRLRADGAVTIAYDITFHPPRPGQEALMRALGRARNRTILATERIDSRGGTELFGFNVDRTARTLKALGSRAAYAGLLLAPGGEDTYRWVESRVALPGAKGGSRTFSFAAARRYAKARARGLPRGYRGRAWIDYRGPEGAYPRHSLLDVYRGRVSRGTFAGRLVVVGSSETDRHGTPFGDMAGPEIQLNAIQTHLAGRPLRGAGRLADLLLIAGLGLLPLATLRMRLRSAVSSLVLAAGLVAVAAQLLFAAGRVVPLVLPLATLALSSVAVLLVRSWTRPQRRRRPAPPTLTATVRRSGEDASRMGSADAEPAPQSVAPL